ncbi:MAG TPA: response regulator transcription factor [Polyangiaceae bacterium LLY-WYZ-15_(1-7)]|nr:response regulator transcription factor [Polyangiaceae bacterium LLY-WYZ-15_(1-7)]HJL01860.1 response regulator transcription factor [Polyangiaceae bacterium LLY-WYZ-15_(1-7)]HJL09006.1 response regulator transcription factor [Polyangiaceae bacterium LLY-WYZ-15_(1-7)]HJL24529.1 response regulator transcription factor [Polyangiaceae bacterium LLY-WYZ-15_(1-7)]HJL31629.1 response regulator transcription factor [Polyangiaceae bacterium LLY-WYZ-15_(1-7)]
MGTGRVLLVEDDPGLRGTLLRLLRMSYEVRAASCLAEARDELAEQRFDLLVTDIHLGDGRGTALLEELARDPDAPLVILITGQPSVATAVQALRLSAVDYLVKPLRPEQVLARVDAALERRAAQQAVARASRHAEEIAAAFEAVQKVLGTGSAPPPAREGEPTLPGLTADELEKLSPREREVCEVLVSGRSAKEVAEVLYIAPNTVRNHMRSIYEKLDVHSRVELVLKLTGR